MDKNNDGFFCSQPVPKTTKNHDNNWRRVRRPSIVDVSGTSSSSHSVGHEEEHPVERPQQSNTFAVVVEETRNWSKDALDFYNNGDAPFCHSRFITKPLDRKFWGALLGLEDNGCLSSLVSDYLNFNYIATNDFDNVLFLRIIFKFMLYYSMLKHGPLE